jgi:hypothetical protein
MTEINLIENRISLLESPIEFEEIVDDYLSETFSEEEIKAIDKLSFRKDKIEELHNRFTEIYGMDILEPEDGFSILNVKDCERFYAKKYLHRFLSYKCKTGGANASVDGSAELFEKISANAAKNYLGNDAKIIMVGEGRVNLTEERLKQISNEMYENLGVYCNLPNRAKDDGVDFIVYKPFDTRNIGNLVILGQACVGKHYTDKNPIYQRWQDEYITYAVKPPTTLLSVVYFLDADLIRKLHSKFHNSIVFDRGRIMKYYNTADNVLNNQIIDFVTTNIDDE